MFRYQLLIEYLGTNYKGWQIQKKNKTIQGILQDKIRKLLKENITIVGSGRTDAGVHALEQSGIEVSGKGIPSVCLYYLLIYIYK